MKRYKDLLKRVMKNGTQCEDRTGTGTISTVGESVQFDLKEGFPAVTTKKLAWEATVSELLWFLEGSDDERRLAEIRYEKPREELIGKKTIWTANADVQGVALGYENNDLVKKLGCIYGVSWRNPVDQIQLLIDGLKNNPNSRRHILTAWLPDKVDQMALPPCHTLSQFVVKDGLLHCVLYMRSNDLFLGAPLNIASYSLLTHMLAQICDLGVGTYTHHIGDAHIYLDHIEQVETQLSRRCKKLPTLEMPKFKTLEELLQTKTSDYKLVNYNYHPAIKAKMSA